MPCEDPADELPCLAQESEGEEAAEARVALPQDMGRGNLAARQSRVRLQEIGPRMELEVVKVSAAPSSRCFQNLSKPGIHKVMYASRDLHRVFQRHGASDAAPHGMPG